jgi:hypothetical protein
MLIVIVFKNLKRDLNYESWVANKKETQYAKLKHSYKFRAKHTWQMNSVITPNVVRLAFDLNEISDFPVQNLRIILIKF